jgi:hypothetical protein
MRTAAANEDSLVQDGQPLALPPSPALSTRNTVIAAGAALQVYASGTDTILWEEQATPQTGSVTITAGRSLTFFYALGIWYIVAEGNASAASQSVTSYNGRQGPVTSRLSDVGVLFGAQGQIIGGTGAGAADLVPAGSTGQALYTGVGSDASGMGWAAPNTIGGTIGPPTTGTWLAGQTYADVSSIIWVCVIAGTPGTWTCPPGTQLSRWQYNPVTAGPVSATATSLTLLDSTHLVMPNFVVPYNGAVVYRFEMICVAPSAGVNIYIQPYCTTLGAIGRLEVFSQTGETGGNALRLSHTWEVVGLTPGTTIVGMQPAYQVDSGSATYYAGGADGNIFQIVSAT